MTSPSSTLRDEKSRRRENDAPGTALSIRDLSMSFGGIKALHNVSFDVPAGSLTAVIGPNGAGKTTLFNCVSGFYRGTGEIRSFGHRLDGAAPSARAGLGVRRTFQTPVLLDEESVLSNVLVGAHTTTTGGVYASFFGLPGRRASRLAAEEKAHDLLRRFGLDDIVDRVAGGLPHKARRLVEISRALMSHPRLLLLDEPAAGSHHGEAMEMIQQVSDVCVAQDVSVVLVEHNVALVMAFAQQVVVLDFGKVLASGTPQEIQANDAVVAAYLGEVPA